MENAPQTGTELKRKQQLLLKLITGLSLTWASLLIFAGCSSPGGQPPGAPGWVHAPARTVDSGYIVYVGIGEDFSPERANFKAEGSAIQDIANECSFAPKGARVEDRFDYSAAGKYQAYAKVGISFEDCEQAKQTLDPEKIRTTANVAMTQELKQYQEVEYTPATPETEVAQNPGNPALSNTVYQDDGQYFVARQQVAYAKEIVIISPAGTYAPGTPQNQIFVSQVSQPSFQIQQYEQVHPQIRTWHNSWSGYERNPSTNLPASIPRRRAFAGPTHSSYRPPNPALGNQHYNNRNGGENGVSNGKGQGRRRRRKNPEENQ